MSYGEVGHGEVQLSSDQIATRIRELGTQITEDYAGREPHLICVLNGAFLFMADLVRNIELPLTILHSPDCKGLCQECGTNLNQLEAGTCAANKAACPQLKPVKFEPDHPLAGLGNLRDMLKD